MSEQKELSEKHKAFIDEYFLNKQNATQAYKAIYPKATHQSAQRKSTFLLRKVEKSTYFDKKRREKSEKAENSYNENLEKLREVIRLGLEGDDVFAKDGTTYKKRQLAAVTAAINEINKMEGNHAETKIKLSGFLDLEHSGTVNLKTEVIKVKLN